MSRALSVDLRVRVLGAVADCATHREAAERFGVSAPSVSRWRKRERDQGDPRPGRLGGDPAFGSDRGAPGRRRSGGPSAEDQPPMARSASATVEPDRLSRSSSSAAAETAPSIWSLVCSLEMKNRSLADRSGTPGGMIGTAL